MPPLISTILPHQVRLDLVLCSSSRSGFSLACGRHNGYLGRCGREARAEKVVVTYPFLSRVLRSTGGRGLRPFRRDGILAAPVLVPDIQRREREERGEECLKEREGIERFSELRQGVP